jgi:putative peptide zinc metalloprotease protein
MSEYQPDSLVHVIPFSRQEDGEEIVIGVRETFVALPSSAVDLLDLLAAGKTVGEAQAAYFAQHGEQPDMQDFLSSLEEAGFLAPMGADGKPPPAVADEPAAQPAPLRYHFEGFPRSVAKVLTSWGAIALYGSVALAALLALLTEPSLLPRWKALLFTRNMTQMGLALLAYSFVMLFLHEMAHLVAARAAGIPSRIGLGHRLWVLVAETDVSRLWTLPRSQRYMTLIAGPLVDLVCASIYLCVGYAALRGWLSLSPLATQTFQALALMHLLNLLWQCNFYLRTDFYYVFSTLFGCKNLMGDTESFLRGKAATWFGLGKRADLSHIPQRELRVVRGYSVFWILGRINMFWILFTVTFPLMWGYFKQISSVLGAGFPADPFAFVDALLLGTITVVMQGAGLAMWLYSLLKRKGVPSHEVAV